MGRGGDSRCAFRQLLDSRLAGRPVFAGNIPI